MMDIEITRVFSIYGLPTHITLHATELVADAVFRLSGTPNYAGARPPTRQPNNRPGFATMHRLKARHSSGDSARNATL